MRKIIGKTLYFGSMIIGGVVALFGNRLGLGMGIIFIGCILGVGIQFANEDVGYSSPKEKEPYYKNDFEKYQHYKIVKKHMK